MNTATSTPASPFRRSTRLLHVSKLEIWKYHAWFEGKGDEPVLVGDSADAVCVKRRARCDCEECRVVFCCFPRGCVRSVSQSVGRSISQAVGGGAVDVPPKQIPLEASMRRAPSTFGALILFLVS